MTDPSAAGAERLLEVLREEYGDTLRSVVEYGPSRKRIVYLRDDIDRQAASGRLVRLDQLYQAERLNNDPVMNDPELDRLHASIYVFDGATVVHVVDRGGAVLGFSVDTAAPVAVGSVTRYLREAFGEVPDSLADLP
ncbi:hypothetical protein N0B31_07905 [Salinirubellus salinus]|uniref:Uncharacterized protein n=1 Tax=Salinirubellus salinus TaxID=1364945 RepID=A0A9E7U9R0_9EURY|nr:hypothetical protein [Salinirubellus salinus]UWM56206.1 hypothetical protein N0B31_07905 [Salinirubellus salinus]